ncbi:MAG: insulinase family protein [Prevotellaceae bacterium]|jgi:predicted Zn-dependent peptidase|nr:insulinase family protein [Prevotellaceae bacterium]
MNNYTLPNGLRVVHRYHTSPVAYCGLSVNAGTRDEIPAENGIAHLTEHMLFKGTQRRSTYYINNRLENVGGELNAFTTKEETVIHATVLKGDMERAVELLADLAFHSVFPDKELRKEKEVIIDEINSCKDHPAELIFDDFDALLFKGSPLGLPILGDPGTLAGMGVEQLKNFTGLYYHPSQMVFSSIGKIKPERMERLVEKYFSGFSATGNKRRRKNPAACKPFHVSKKCRTFQTHCILGNRAYSLHDAKRTGLALLVNYLGGPAANARLNTSLREKNGLVYTIEANYTPYGDSGAVTIYFGVDRENLPQCLELIQKELRAVCAKPFGSASLHRIKKQLLGQLFISADNAETQMLSQGKSVMTYDYVETFELLKARIDALTAQEIQNIAHEIFAPEKLSILTYESYEL